MSDIIEALRPFKEDFLHYAPRALTIRAKSGSQIPLKLNQAQRHIHAMLDAQLKATGKIRALILKGRQQGASTLIEGRFYWRTSMSFGKRALILTHEQSATDALFEMTRRYHDNCPDVLRPSTRTASAKELLFDQLDSGYVVATAGSKNTGRGRTIQLFHGSECAFWPNAEDHFAGIGQAVPDMDGTEIILESTANGVGNLFHKMWQDAERGIGDYIAIFVPWFWQAEYARAVSDDFVYEGDETEYAERYDLSREQIAWRRQKIQSDFRGDVDLFDQEYPAEPALAFSRSRGNPFITMPVVQRAQRYAGAAPTGVKIMGIDPAEYGDDSSAIAMRQGRVCSEIKAMHGIDPMELVGHVSALADKWKPDAICVDATGVGSGVYHRLKELGYPVYRIMFGARADVPELYGIKRDEIWGNMREWFNDDVSIPKDDALLSDICAPEYTYDSSRRIKIESKESMKKRGIKSPDRADALALTFAVNFSAETQTYEMPPPPDWRT